MKLKILGCGTSTGVPVPGCKCPVCRSANPRNHRLRTSALLTGNDNLNILIDASTDLRQQSLKFSVDRIDAVLITHAHADHILGLDDLRAFNYVRQGPIPCYATAATWEEVRRIFSYIFNPDPNYEGGAPPHLTVNTIEYYAPFQIGITSIEAVELGHGRMSVAGFKFGQAAYATDCKTIAPRSRQALKGLRYLVLDGLRNQEHKTHMTIPEAVKMSQELGIEATYLTHMTHTVDYDQANAGLPPGVQLAYDGLEIEF